ncbi:type IX secretion system protein PorD [Soonwooa purpurea]
MKKLFSIFILLIFSSYGQSQELLANVQINYQQIGGSNVQTYKTLEKSLKDFINNTSWTGKRLQNFEKIKSNFAIVISERAGSTFKGSIVVQATRPIFNSQYDSPLINFNDTNFGFEYNENENLVFNERQFSGKNLIDVVSFYVYVILGYDSDSFKVKGGQPWFDKALKISQNSMNNNYAGWSQVEGLRSRGALIDAIQNENNSTLRNAFYTYHRIGLDNLAKTDQTPAKKNIADALLTLKVYENNFQMNPAFNLFIDTKKNEIFSIFDSNNNGSVNMNDLKQLMSMFAPNEIDTKWNKWK